MQYRRNVLSVPYQSICVTFPEPNPMSYLKAFRPLNYELKRCVRVRDHRQAASAKTEFT